VSCEPFDPHQHLRLVSSCLKPTPQTEFKHATWRPYTQARHDGTVHTIRTLRQFYEHLVKVLVLLGRRQKVLCADAFCVPDEQVHPVKHDAAGVRPYNTPITSNDTSGAPAGDGTSKNVLHSLFMVYVAVLLKIALVTRNHDGDVRTHNLSQLLHPSTNLQTDTI